MLENVEQISLTNTHSLEGNASAGCKSYDPVKYKISLYDSLTAPHFTMLPQDMVGVFKSHNNENLSETTLKIVLPSIKP